MPEYNTSPWKPLLGLIPLVIAGIITVIGNAHEKLDKANAAISAF